MEITTETPTKQFKPEIWDTAAPDLEPSIRQALDSMNAEDTDGLIASLRATERIEGGVRYAIFKGTPEEAEQYSTSDAIVVMSPFTGVLTPTELLRAEFLRRVAQSAGIQDGEGKLKPIILLANPGIMGSKLALTPDERQAIRGGELGPVAEKLLRAVTAQGIGRIALLGFSSGADLALAGARAIHDDQTKPDGGTLNLSVQSIGIAEPSATEERGSVVRLQGDFGKAGPAEVRKSRDRTGLPGLKRHFGYDTIDNLRFIVSTLFYRTNRDLVHGLTHATVASGMRDALEQHPGSRLAVAYGSESAIARPDVMESALEELEGYGERVIPIEVTGGNHTWGNQLTLLAKLMLRAEGQSQPADTEETELAPAMHL